MRIERLDLKAYGPFTDHSLDLAAPGVHLVLGPNEAGKSTTLSAIHDALFGIRTRTEAGFVHDMRSLVIGIRLRRSDDTVLEFQRLKKAKNNLVRPDGTFMDPGELTGFLGAVDADAFTQMYGIGHDQLVKGGTDLLQGKGELGRAIFGASVGAVNLHAALEKLESQMGDLYKPSGDKPPLNAAIRRHGDSLKAAREHSLRPAEYGELSARIDKLERRIADRKQARVKIAAQVAEAQLLLNALEKVRARRRAINSLHELEGTTLRLRSDIGDEFEGVRQALTRCRQDLQRSINELELIDGQLAAITAEPVVLEHAGAIERLREGRAKHQAQIEEVPILRSESESTGRSLDALLMRLGTGLTRQTAPAALTFPNTLVVLVDDLIQQEVQLQVEAETAARSLADSTAKLSNRQQKLDDLPPVPDHRQLEASLRGCRSVGDLTTGRDKLTEALSAAGSAVAVMSVELGLGNRPLPELITLPVPTAPTISQFQKRHVDERSDLKSLEVGLEDQMARRAARDEELQSLLGQGRVPTEGDLDDARSKRDLQWGVIRRAWTGVEAGEGVGAVEPSELNVDPTALADSYQAAVAGSDAVADQLRSEADTVARRSSLESQIRELDEVIAETTKKRDERITSMTSLEDDWNELWSPTGVCPSDPDSGSEWRNGFEKLTVQISEVTRLTGDLASLDLAILDQREDLRRALDSVGQVLPPETLLPTLLQRCEDEVTQLSLRRNEREQLITEVTQLAEQAEELTAADASAREALAEWQTRWDEALGQFGQVGLTPAQARVFLNDAAEAVRQLATLNQLSDRLVTINESIAEYRSSLVEIAVATGEPHEQVETLTILDGMTRRLGQAKADDQTMKQLETRRSTTSTRLAEERADIETHEEQLRQLFSEAQVDNVADLHEAIERSDRLRSHQADVERLEAEIATLGKGRPAQELDAAIGDLEEAELQMALDDLIEADMQLQDELGDLNSELGGAVADRKRWDGSADAADAAIDAQFALSDIGEFTEKYLGLKIAAELLKSHIVDFREKNQGPILERATPWFRQLTCGHFDRIEADVGTSGEMVLEAVRPNGKRVTVSGMSEGTRDQMYLVLRLAALAETAKHSEPFPVILDDLLMTFDDERAHAGFKVLGELSETSQIILFTHHEHLRQIAHDALGATRLTCHDLTPLAPSASPR